MNFIKKVSFILSVLIFSFLFTYQPLLVHAQSIEDLQNIQEGIGGGNSEVAEGDNGGDNYIVYVVLGAMVIGVGLYYYLQWAEKKRPSHKSKNNEKKLETKKENTIGKSEKFDKNFNDSSELIID